MSHPNYEAAGQAYGVSDPSVPITPNNRIAVSLTQDEIRVIKECNIESFYFRCVPLSTLFSGLAYMGIKNGYLSKGAKYGYFPKMAAGAMIGYVLGKFSYQNACAEKIMKLENSPLGEKLRARAGHVPFEESLSSEPGFTMSSLEDYGKEVPFIEEQRPDFIDQIEGPDSYSQVKESLSPYTSHENTKSSQPYINYDDLRRENREEHLNKMMEKYRKSSQLQRSPPPQSPGSQYQPSEYDQPREPKAGSPRPYFDSKKNKYGDVWDD